MDERRVIDIIQAELIAVRGRLAEITLHSGRLTKPDQELVSQLADRRRFLEAELADLSSPQEEPKK
jgi:hypothetical protein